MLLLCPPALTQAPPPGPPPQGPGMGGPMGHHHPDMPLLRFSKELGLSQDQMSKIHELLRARRDVMEQKGLAFHQAHRAVHEAIREPGASQSQMDALTRDAAAKESEFLKEMYALNSACWEVLTPSQRSQAKTLVSRPPEEGREGGPHGFGGPGGPGGPGGDRGFGGPGHGPGMPPSPPPGGPDEDGY